LTEASRHLSYQVQWCLLGENENLAVKRLLRNL